MEDPRFLTIDEVIRLHESQLSKFGGRPGVTDSEMLRTAVRMPRAEMAGRYIHDDLHEMAAAYLFHFARNRPFEDMNEQVGAVAAVMFLTINGVRLYADAEEFEDLIHEVTLGQRDKKDIALYFRENSENEAEF